MSDMFSKAGEYNPVSIIAGNQVPLLPEGVTLAMGTGILSAGTVIALLTTDKTGKVVDSTKTDGTEKPYGILTDDVTLSETETTEATVYVSGYFKSDALIFGGTDTAAIHKATLRTLGIYLI
ncbi:head decoration protein [Cellulosilyticum sp. I15G10I2]|uniref:head decoration protein n=1 Tax=Cellulosilyticum sp. I15G10I2 TaxID=1892843 RepID=UPI00085BC7DA|nr:head decoration protein [Cellulosilyticum sp. I15G10I2]